MKLKPSKKTAIILVILLAVLLNACAFLAKFPETSQPEASNLARDFSAYYIGEWRLFHNPTQVYFNGVLPGDYPIHPTQQAFKYMPSFLILFAPFIALNYQTSLSAFDIMQVLLIPALGYFVYKLVKDKNLYLAIVISLIVIVDPILFSNSISYNSVGWLQSRIYNLPEQTFSPMYSIGYWLVNAHILQTILLVGALSFGFIKKPWASALLFVFGSFDPRAAVFAIPLLLWYNRHSLGKFLAGSAVFFAATNLPFFFYYGIGFSFLSTEVHGSIVSSMYLYDWLPLYAVGALTVAEILTELYKRKVWTHFHFSQGKLANQQAQPTA